MRLYANTDEFERVDKWLETGAASDPHIARQLRQLHLAYKGG
jgi:hypothetical protein